MRSWHLAVLIPVVAFVAGLDAPPPAAAADRTCGRFIVGQANSSVYPKMRLPARGVADGASCAILLGIARRLHDGTYTVPDSAQTRPGRYGDPFPIRHGGGPGPAG